MSDRTEIGLLRQVIDLPVCDCKAQAGHMDHCIGVRIEKFLAAWDSCFRCHGKGSWQSSGLSGPATITCCPQRIKGARQDV